MISCIYQIVNNVTGRRYIGSTVNYHRRSAGHRCDLRKNRHGNSYLQRSWLKHGEKSFTFSIIERVEDHSLLPDKEQAYLDAAQPNVYNRGRWTIAPWRGTKMSVNHRNELSVAWESRRFNAKKSTRKQERAFRRKIRESRAGHCIAGHARTSETTSYRFDRKRGKSYPMCLVCRKAKRKADYFAAHGPDPRIGKPLSQWRKDGLKAAWAKRGHGGRTGHTHSPEVRAKMRKAWILRKSRQMEAVA